MQTDFVDDDRVLIAPSITYKPTASTSLTLLGKYQKDDTGSATAFLPHVGTFIRAIMGNVFRSIASPASPDSMITRQRPPQSLRCSSTSSAMR